MNEDLPSINDFIENRSNLPSLNESVESDLPSYKDFIEEKGDNIVVNMDGGVGGSWNIQEEVQTIEDADGNSFAEVKDIIPPFPELIRMINDVRKDIPDIPEIKSYDEELYQLTCLIEELRKDIPDIPEFPEVKYYDDEIQELKESIPTVPEVKYYDTDISELKEGLQEIKERDIPDFRWISKSFTVIDEDFESVNSSIATLKGKLSQEVTDIVESIEVAKFESKVDSQRIDSRVDTAEESINTSKIELTEKINEVKDKIYEQLRDSSLEIWKLNKEYKNEDKKLREETLNQYKSLKENLQSTIDGIVKKTDKDYIEVNEYFQSLKKEVSNLPKIKYYDEDIKKVNQSVDSVRNLVEVLENKLNKKIAGLKESILVVPPTDNNTDPLTPLDQNFATLEDLSSHYRLFLNRIQQQLATLGGGGETKFRYLDDVVGVATNLSAYDGMYLQVDTSDTNQPFKFSTVSGGGGGGIANTSDVRDAIQGYYGYTTDYYTVGVANTVQEIGAGVTTLVQPQVAAVYQHLPTVMTGVSTNPYVGTGATVGTGQTEFSLAGLGTGASCIVRTALAFDPDEDNTNLDVQLKFTTNTATQGTGLTNFTIKKEQALIMNEGADQQYISENLFSFFVGSTLEGTTQSDAGSFSVEVISSNDGELEVLTVTVNVVA